MVFRFYGSISASCTKYGLSTSDVGITWCVMADVASASCTAAARASSGNILPKIILLSRSYLKT